MVLGNFVSANIRTFGKTKLFPSGSDIKVARLDFLGLIPPKFEH